MQQLRKFLSYIRTYRFSSIFVKSLIAIFCSIVFPTFILYSATYTVSRNNTNEYVSSISLELCNTTKNITDTLLDEMNTLAINTSINEEVISLMLFPDADKERDNRLRNYLKNYQFVYDYLDSAYIFCEDNQKVICSDLTVTNLSELNDRGWYEIYESMTDTKGLTKFRKYNNHYPYFLTIVQPVYATSSLRTGAVVLNIDVKKLFKSFKNKNFSQMQQLMLINNDGQIIYSTDDDKISLLLAEDENATAVSQLEDQSTSVITLGGETFVVSSLHSSGYDWAYYSAIPTKQYQTQLSGLITTLLIMIVVSLCLSIVISTYISKKIFSPIESIMTMLDTPVPWQIPDGKKKLNETDYILQKIFQTKQANQRLIEEQENRLEILKRAQTLMLQLQINPHFLGNTLNAISWMAIDLTMSNNEVSKAITTLAHMYKINSDTTNYMTDLESEILYTKQYIDLMQLRYPNTFDVVWIYEDYIKNAKLPRVLLQPLVENAVYYGIVPSQKRGTITVKVTCEKGIITIIVSDTGIGMDKEKMDLLNRAFLDEYVYFDGSIGLKNVNQRLRLIYGEEYGVQLRESKTGGVEAILQFPYIT